MLEKNAALSQASKFGTLWPRVVAQTQHALSCGALQPIPTHSEIIEQGGIRFLVRVLATLDRKAEARKQQAQQAASGQEINPFLPYDPDLFVANLSDTHLCLLNKFNVVDHHLLLVTRAFEEQETLLNLQDFEALWLCLAEIEGLAFYNSGKAAGASQRHKHLQLVPLPIALEDSNIPVQAVLSSAQWQNAIGTISAFPFMHALALFNFDPEQSLKEVAQTTLECYHKLLAAVNLSDATKAQPDAYNLLMTRQWMLVVPRMQEQFEGISVNSLGFAGTLFVRNSEQLQRLKNDGPLALLRGVARSAS